MYKLACLILLCSLSLSSSFGQGKELFYARGMVFAEKTRFKEALVQYNRALGMDSSFLDARVGRANARFALKDYTGALYDYSYAIKKRPRDTILLYNHAVCNATLHEVPDAIKDMNRLIAVTPKNGEAHFFKAQLCKSLHDGKDSACVEFRKAFKLNYQDASIPLQSVCNELLEDYSLPWDSGQGWKGFTSRNDADQVYRNLMKKGESLTKYTERGSIIIYKNKGHISLPDFKLGLLKSTLKSCTGAKMRVLEYDSLSPLPTMVFSIECPEYTSTGKPESQLVKLIGGKYNFFFISVSTPQASPDEAYYKKWLAFFQKGRLILN